MLAGRYLTAIMFGSRDSSCRVCRHTGYSAEMSQVELLRDVADKRSDRRKLLKNVRGGTIIRLLEGAPPRGPREDARGIP